MKIRPWVVLIDVFKNEAALTTPFIRNFFCFVGIVELPWDGLHITPVWCWCIWHFAFPSKYFHLLMISKCWKQERRE